MTLLAHLCLKVSRAFQDNNKPGLTVFKRLYVASSATKNAWDGALQIMVVDGTFLRGHIFDQVILCAVTYGSNNI